MNLKKIRLADFGLYAMAFCITSFPGVASIGLILFVISQLWGWFSDRKKPRLLLILPFVLIFLPYVFGLVYSPDINYGVEVILKVSALIIIPFTMSLRKTFPKDTVENTKKIYVLGVSLSCLISLGIANLSYFLNGDTSVFTYYDLAGILHLHPTYLSFYILIAFLFVPEFSKRPLKMGFYLIFIVTVLLLESRMAYILGLIILIYQIGILSRRRRSALFLIFLPITLILVFFFSPLSKRMSQLTVIDYTGNHVGTTMENGVNQRLWLWVNAIEQIKKQPILGFGLGSQKSVFRWEIQKKLLYNSYDERKTSSAKSLSHFNLHNQYLQYLYEFGLVGLLTFIFGLGLLAYLLYRNRGFLGYIVLSMFCVFLLTENMLDRQMGLYIFSFILSFLLFSHPRQLYDQSSSSQVKDRSEPRHFLKDIRRIS